MRFYIIGCIFFHSLTTTLVRAQSCNLICNGNFDNIRHTNAQSWAQVPNGSVPCWRTTGSSGFIEVWASGMNRVSSFSGEQFIEINSSDLATIYQDFTVSPGTNVTLSFAHRGRLGIDTMSVSIGPVGGPYFVLGSYGDGNTAWGYHTINYTIPSGMGNFFSLRFNSVYSSGGDPSFGNFLDSVSVSGCIDTIIEPVVSIYIPNTFTPNGDGLNEVFLASGIGIDPNNFEMCIYDRWGNFLFTSTNPDNGWDGSVKGKEKAQIDVYIYKIKYNDVLGEAHKHIGRINLIR